MCSADNWRDNFDLHFADIHAHDYPVSNIMQISTQAYYAVLSIHGRNNFHSSSFHLCLHDILFRIWMESKVTSCMSLIPTILISIAILIINMKYLGEKIRIEMKKQKKLKIREETVSLLMKN